MDAAGGRPSVAGICPACHVPFLHRGGLDPMAKMIAFNEEARADLSGE
jgi:hypothetical protein